MVGSGTIITLAVVAIGGYWLFFMGGMSQVQGFMGDFSSRIGLSGPRASGSGDISGAVDDIMADVKAGREGQWTDENGNKFNVQKDSRSTNNVSGNVSASKITADVEAMLRKMGVHGSRQNISRTRQVDTTGKAVQKQSHTQSAFFISNHRLTLR